LTHLRVSKRTSWQLLSASPNISYEANASFLLGLDAPDAGAATARNSTHT